MPFPRRDPRPPPARDPSRPPAPLRSTMTVPAGAAVARLAHDPAADAWRVTLDPPGPLPAEAEGVLTDNGFSKGPDGAWSRAVDRSALFQDVIDAERVLLAAAGFCRADDPKPVPAKKSGRGRRR